MTPLKINLGAGYDHRQGYINVDIDPTTHPDKIVDLGKSLPWADASVDEVLLQDVLEHFLKTEGEQLLTEISRILKPGGVLRLRIPNLEQIQIQFENDPEVMMEFVYGTTDKNGIWGVHKYGYTKESLEKLLKTKRFDHITIESQTTNLVATCCKSTRKPVVPTIAVIEQAPDWGGAEEWMTTLVASWQKKGFVVTGYTNLKKLGSVWQEKGARTGNIPFVLDIIGNYKGLIKSIILFPYALIWYTVLLVKLKKQGVNCVVMSGFSEKLLATAIASVMGLPVIWFEYGPLKQVFKKNLYLPKVLYRLTKNIPEAVFTISELTKQSLIVDARVSLAKIKVVAPGVSLPSKIHPLPSRLVIGHLSRLAPEKGQRLLLECFAIFAKTHPNAKLVIAGRGPDSKYLEEYAQRLNIASKIEFLGFVQNKREFYNNISLFVFPGIWELEGFGMVMAEAMAHGRSVVAVDNGPTREVLGDSGGILSAPNPQALADAIEAQIKKGLKSQAKLAYLYAKTHYQDTIQAELVGKSIVDVVNYHQR